MRALWLIDGSYIYKSMKSYQISNPQFANKGVDYKKLKDKLMEEFKIDSMDSWYFNSTFDPVADTKNSYHQWLMTAEPKGPNIRVKLYGLKKKTYRCPSCGREFPINVQKGVDVGIATIALRFYHRYDMIVLSAGDGDFEDFIRYIIEDKDIGLYIAGFNGSISSNIQQYSTRLFALDEHYAEICDARIKRPFEDEGEYVDTD